MDIKEVHEKLSKTALDNDWELTSNKKKLLVMERVMAKNAQGDVIICPCKLFVLGMVELSSVQCPCAEAPAQIQQDGQCHCNVFTSKRCIKTVIM